MARSCTDAGRLSEAISRTCTQCSKNAGNGLQNTPNPVAQVCDLGLTMNPTRTGTGTRSLPPRHNPHSPSIYPGGKGR
jgi:hypothetical protein